MDGKEHLFDLVKADIRDDLEVRSHRLTVWPSGPAQNECLRSDRQGGGGVAYHLPGAPL
jgi:hypothetical protein